MCIKEDNCGEKKKKSNCYEALVSLLTSDQIPSHALRERDAISAFDP